jgi:hypothetical protein
MRFIINQHADFPTELSLPWQTPLADWPAERLLNVTTGNLPAHGLFCFPREPYLRDQGVAGNNCHKRVRLVA